ncbi:MAG: hydantoinase/oxoprolinase family protein, partial [Nitrospinota bacterium]
MADLSRQKKWNFWVDRGGTFTDIIGISPEGKSVTKKLLSENQKRYPDSVLEGIRVLLGVGKSDRLPFWKIGSVKIGTTVSTNALLERKGEPVLLCITKGFGDALKIGYQQRPHLFERRILLPAPLYASVYEVDERIGKDGLVLKAPDVAEVKRRFRGFLENGISSVAIVLMHGWRHNGHELLLEELARESGFKNVSISSEVSPVISLISRGDTTVVDAYLTPVLNRYVTSLSSKLQNTRLLFMQSGGGLVNATHFRGKNSILSGPAGGVAGIVKSGTAEGITKIIGFDMGGTSTDVSLYEGNIEHCSEKAFDGIRVRAPAVRVHTVAAGGGSMLFFDGMRYRVGPKSAGSDPGPCCYGNDGPLTITDANLVVGKIIPDSFPKVFGPEGDRPLNKDRVLAKVDLLKKEMAVASGKNESSENIAEGFINIANRNMALAIKEISVSRGYDVTKYTLCCFGGAGGQHACGVADILGIKKIFIPPYAGVLSALGIGLSDLQASAERSVERSLSVDSLKSLDREFAALEQSVLETLFRQGAPRESVEIIKKIGLRYEGTSTSFTFRFAPVKRLTEKFEEKHRKYFGFVMKDKELTVETVQVDGLSRSFSESLLVPDRKSSKSLGQPECKTRLFSGGTWHQAPVYTRRSMGEGFSLAGPAIILEESGTTVLDPGWRLSVSEKGGLYMARSEALKKPLKIHSKCDPVLLEIFNNIFGSV